MAWREAAGLSLAWQARHGLYGYGADGYGLAGEESRGTVWLGGAGKVRRGTAWLGVERQAWIGAARCGQARNGKAGIYV